VPEPDDERFEAYLKKFHPLLPEALALNEIRPEPRRHLVRTIWAMGSVVAMVILGVATFRVLIHRATGESNQSATVKSLAPTPLTMRRANDLLAKAPSYKDLMNGLALRPKRSTLSKSQQSAFAVLGKEKIKL
jgi:hypothetical protein